MYLRQTILFLLTPQIAHHATLPQHITLTLTHPVAHKVLHFLPENVWHTVTVALEIPLVWYLLTITFVLVGSHTADEWASQTISNIREWEWTRESTAGGGVKSSRHLYWKLKTADTPNNFLLLTVENNATTMILSLSLSEHGFPPCQLVCAIANKKPAIWGRMELIFTHCLCFWFSTRTFFRIVHLFRRRLFHMKALHANCYRFLFLACCLCIPLH